MGLYAIDDVPGKLSSILLFILLTSSLRYGGFCDW